MRLSKSSIWPRRKKGQESFFCCTTSSCSLAGSMLCLSDLRDGVGSLLEAFTETSHDIVNDECCFSGWDDVIFGLPLAL